MVLVTAIQFLMDYQDESCMPKLQLWAPCLINAKRRNSNIRNAKRSSRGRTVDGLGVMGLNLMLAEIKNCVLKMKFISHQRRRDFGCVVTLNFFSCLTIAPNAIHESVWTTVYVVSWITHLVVRL
jgi:hypothetical protein